jgi:hypothetical protein
MPKCSNRAMAWRNLMVAAINAALERRLFSLAPGEPWSWPEDEHGERLLVFRFSLDGMPAIASVRDAGWDEVSVHAAILPTPDADRWIVAGNAGFLAGDAFAAGRLERREGTYLQASSGMFKCRRHCIDALARTAIEPAGFADHGKLRM